MFSTFCKKCKLLLNYILFQFKQMFNIHYHQWCCDEATLIAEYKFCCMLDAKTISKFDVYQLSNFATKMLRLTRNNWQ